MNYLPRQAAIVSSNGADADFAESTIASYGFQVSRFASPEALTSHLQSYAGDRAADSSAPSVAILVGSTDEFAGHNREVGSLSAMVPVVVTSSSSTVAGAVELMKQGAKDVVELPCDREELWERVRQSIDAAEAPSAQGQGVRNAELRARLDQLTQAEQDVVDAMLDGLANKQIAQRLGIGLRTVELRRSKIMRKMQAKSVAELVKFICLAGGIQNDVGNTPAQI